MRITMYKPATRQDGSTEWKGRNIATNSLEPPSARESDRITPQPTGLGGVIVPCFTTKNHDNERYVVELTRRDLLALCEAAGLQIQPNTTGE